MVRIPFLVTCFLFILISHCKADGFQFEEFEMLACTQANNVTIIADFIQLDFLDDLLQRLEPLTRNEGCFTINVYLPSDGFVVQWRPKFNVNHFERNFFWSRYFSNVIRESDLENFLKRLYNEEVRVNDTVKQTLVYLIMGFRDIERERRNISQILQGLQDYRLWNIILHCQNFSPLPNWLPIYQGSFFFTYESAPTEIRNVILKDLLDVIKESDFNRYEYMYQYLLSRDDMFNETCMTGITMIHIYTQLLLHDVYIRYFVALLKKVNALREIKKTQPLSIKIYPTYLFVDTSSIFSIILQDSIMDVRKVFNDLKPKESDVISFYIHDQNIKLSDKICKALSRPNIARYRWASLDSLDCLNTVKTFESIDDLIAMMNEDFCRRQKLN
uniref:Cnidarian restricted protein n=1 Tax=Clytia hemisphaerica TaxID=252671 RepID=A0A7M5V0H8_9CNID